MTAFVALSALAAARLPGWTSAAAFVAGWDKINGERVPWADNPWVWTIGFKRIEAP